MVKISSVKCNRTKYCKYICTRAELKIIPYLYSVIHFNPLQVCGFSGDPETIVGDEKEQTSQLLIKLKSETSEANNTLSKLMIIIFSHLMNIFST